jgi:hypothetical protein
MSAALPKLGNGQQVYDQREPDGVERKVSKPWQKQSGKLDPMPADKRGTIGGVLGQARALFSKQPLEKRASTDALSASVAALTLTKPQEAVTSTAPADFGQRSTTVTATIADARSELDPLASAKEEELAKIEARKRAQIKQLGLLKTAFCDRYASEIAQSIKGHATAVNFEIEVAPTKEELDTGYDRLRPEQQLAYNWVIVELQTNIKTLIKHREKEVDLLQDLTSQQWLKDAKSLRLEKPGLLKDIVKICPVVFTEPKTYLQEE